MFRPSSFSFLFAGLLAVAAARIVDNRAVVDVEANDPVLVMDGVSVVNPLALARDALERCGLAVLDGTNELAGTQNPRLHKRLFESCVKQLLKDQVPRKKIRVSRRISRKPSPLEKGPQGFSHHDVEIKRIKRQSNNDNDDNDGNNDTSRNNDGNNDTSRNNDGNNDTSRNDDGNNDTSRNDDGNNDTSRNDDGNNDTSRNDDGNNDTSRNDDGNNDDTSINDNNNVDDDARRSLIKRLLILRVITKRLQDLDDDSREDTPAVRLAKIRLVALARALLAQIGTTGGNTSGEDNNNSNNNTSNNGNNNSSNNSSNNDDNNNNNNDDNNDSSRMENDGNNDNNDNNNDNDDSRFDLFDN